MRYSVILTMSGIDPATGKCFCKDSTVGLAKTRKYAQELYSQFLQEHRFKPSERYGIFLSIVCNGRSIVRQQIN